MSYKPEPVENKKASKASQSGKPKVEAKAKTPEPAKVEPKVEPKSKSPEPAKPVVSADATSKDKQPEPIKDKPKVEAKPAQPKVEAKQDESFSHRRAVVDPKQAPVEDHNSMSLKDKELGEIEDSINVDRSTRLMIMQSEPPVLTNISNNTPGLCMKMDGIHGIPVQSELEFSTCQLKSEYRTKLRLLDIRVIGETKFVFVQAICNLVKLSTGDVLIEAK